MFTSKSSFIVVPLCRTFSSDVFDERKVHRFGNTVPLATCTHCKKPCDEYINCHHLDCDALFICCPSCQQKMAMTCSEECKDAPHQRKVKKTQAVVGIVENYFPKARVAAVRLVNNIAKNQKIVFAGRTTQEFEQEIVELRDDDGQIIESASDGQVVSFPILNKVRKNDKVMHLVA